MQVSVEKTSPVERRVTIVVPANEVENAFHRQIQKIAKESQLKGFRPGKVPLSFIEKRFGEEARREALSEVIRQNLYAALSQEKLEPVSTPNIDPKAISANEPLEFVASFEVMPDIEKINFSLEKIEKLKVDITDEDVERVITQLQKQQTKWTIVERPAQLKDRVVIDYQAIFEGKTDDNKGENQALELGSHIMIPGFEEGLIGANPNEERKLNLRFPDDFYEKEKAGKPIEFDVKIKQIFAGEMPALDEHFFKSLGVQSGLEKDLKEQIKNSLMSERDRLVKENFKSQVFQNLVSQNVLEVPPSLVKREAKLIHDEIYQREHDHQKHTEEELVAFNDLAKKRVIIGILIHEYAKQSHVKADKIRVQKRIQEIASAYENPREIIAYLSAEERYRNIEVQILEDQVVERLTKDIPVEEKVISYAELKGIRI